MPFFSFPASGNRVFSAVPIAALSDFFHLRELQIDRRGTPEDRNGDLDAGFFFLDILDRADEGIERTVDDFDGIADFEHDGRARLFDTFLDLAEDAADFALRNRLRLAIAAQEASDFLGVLHQMPGLVVEFHFHQHIAGEEFAFGGDFLAAANFDDLFSRYDDFFELIGDVILRELFADGLRYLLLEAGVRMYAIPAGRQILFLQP